ncbi:sugar phosphate isomerase/epimerase family protein [Paenibacillus sp. WLX1005]|uniref:sugar phosphate isomerase/epimerase family protein n=1 Tax=Paenibacillus sp. WLX1005 TaxID=3243766 RepID=UPI0039840AB1
MIKLSVFTVCTPELTPEQLIQAAEAAGIQGIEWRYAGIPQEATKEAPSFWRNNRCSIDPQGDAAIVDTIRQQTDKHRMRSIALVPYVKCGDLDAAAQAFATAKQLDVQMMRVGVPSYTGERHIEDLQEEAVRYLDAIQDMAQQYGIKALVETHHGTIAPSASLALRLVERFNPAHIGVLYDPGNLVHEGYEHHRMGLEMLGPYLAHVHVKNAAWQQQNGQWQSDWAPLNEGIVRWAPIVRHLQQLGYDGYLGVEDFSGQWAGETMLRHFTDTFLALIRQDHEQEALL